MFNLWETWLEYQTRLVDGLLETFAMVLVSFIFAISLGTPLGLILALCGKNRPFENRYLQGFLAFIINTIRSIPFMLFMIIMIPVARFFLGTGFGIGASIISLSIIGASISSRLVEQSILDLNPALYQTAKSFGFGGLKTIWKIVLVEARSSLVLGYTSVLISLIAYSMVVGIVNGGGIGTLAITDGLNLWRTDLMIIIIIILVLVIQIIQMTGSLIARLLDQKKGN